MADPDTMNVINRSDELLKILACMRFFQPLVLHNYLEKLPVRCVLHYKVQVIVCFDYLVELDDIRVVGLLQDFDLSGYPLYVFFLFYF